MVSRLDAMMLLLVVRWWRTRESCQGRYLRGVPDQEGEDRRIEMMNSKADSSRS